MFDIGLQELVVIFVLALLVFGPRNLPQLGRSLGRAMREFRRASEEFRSTIETNLEINSPDPAPSPFPEAAPVDSATAVATPASAEAPAPAPGHDAPLAPGGEEPPGEPFLAQRGAKLFHCRDCGWARRVSEPERLYFKRVADARESGFLACPVCDPSEAA